MTIAIATAPTDEERHWFQARCRALNTSRLKSLNFLNAPPPLGRACGRRTR